MSIVKSWTVELRGLFQDSSLFVRDVRIGVFYTAVQLSTGHVGVAFTPRGLTDSICCPKTAAAAPPAGTLVGRNAWEVANYSIAPSPLRRALGIAALNSISAAAIERYGVPGGRLAVGVDALDAAAVHPDDKVAMVGAFTPFIKRLRGKCAELFIIDNHPEALKPDELHMWRTPHLAAEVLETANVVIISGSAMVEGDLDPLLRSAAGARRIVLAGPTASPWPPPFFTGGIDVLGGIRASDPGRLLALVSEGGSGYFFDRAAEKVAIIRESPAHSALRP